MPTAEIIHGDCLEVMDSLIQQGAKVNLTVTSPPYDNLRTYEGSLEWNENIWKRAIEQLHELTADGGVVVWVVGDATIKGSETGTSFKQALWAMECGFRLHDTMIYQKNSLTFPDSNRYYQCFEYMFIFSKGKPSVCNQIKDRKNKKAGKAITGNTRDADGSLKEKIGSKNNRKIKDFGVRWNIWKYNTGWKHSYTEDWLRGHPAIFPEKLAHDHITSWSNEGDTVFDPFMGSGTTGAAALGLGRNFIGIEREAEYVAIARARIEAKQKELDKPGLFGYT